MAEGVLGCKSSLAVLQLVRQGICHPGAIERSLEDSTTTRWQLSIENLEDNMLDG
jgi:hypothetical protein